MQRLLAKPEYVAYLKTNCLYILKDSGLVNFLEPGVRALVNEKIARSDKNANSSNIMLRNGESIMKTAAQL